MYNITLHLTICIIFNYVGFWKVYTHFQSLLKVKIPFLSNNAVTNFGLFSKKSISILNYVLKLKLEKNSIATIQLKINCMVNNVKK